MNCVIRADAGTEIGSGHVMRCLTLADELRQRHTDVCFICREGPGNLIRFIETREYKVYHIPKGVSIGAERQFVQHILREEYPAVPDWLIIDHYEFSKEDESFLRSSVKQIMVIDDFENRSHDCDLFLNQNYKPYYNCSNALVPKHCVQLLGPQYALLRPQFRRARERSRRHDNTNTRIFVFMGGSDQDNLTSKVLRSIHRLEHSDIDVDVVLGLSNPHRDGIERLASRIPNTTCHIQVENIAEFMFTADIGIGAAGTTTWERCCVGLPSVVMVLADNQRDIAEDLDKNGIVTNLGWYDTVTEVDIHQTIQDLIQHPERRERMSVQGQALVDGKGTTRVVENMLALS